MPLASAEAPRRPGASPSRPARWHVSRWTSGGGGGRGPSGMFLCSFSAWSLWHGGCRAPRPRAPVSLASGAASKTQTGLVARKGVYSKRQREGRQWTPLSETAAPVRAEAAGGLCAGGQRRTRDGLAGGLRASWGFVGCERTPPGARDAGLARGPRAVTQRGNKKHE